MHDPMQPQNNNLMPPNEPDHEGAMAKADLYKLANYSVKLFKKIDDNDQLESWVQAKITKAADYIASVYHYLEYEMKFSEFGSKLENSEMYSESEKKELKNKLMEAKEKIRELKKVQADKLSGKKTPKVKESWDDDDEDPDVAKAEKELKKKGVKLPKVKVDPDKDISKLAKKTKKDDDDLDESWDDDDDDDDVKKADAELKKMGKKPIKAHAKADPDKDISKLAKKTKKDDDLDESKRSVKEAVKKAKKDYDGDGEVESEKDEVWGSRMKAAKKSGKMKESAKPDFLDIDKDGDKKEPMKKAAKEKKVDEETKPSAGLSKEKKSAVVKKAKAGGDIGKKGKGFEKVEKAAKAGGAKDPKAVAAAAMWKNVKRESLKESFAIDEWMPGQDAATNDQDIELEFDRDFDAQAKKFVHYLKQHGVEVDNIDDEGFPVIVATNNGEQVAWFDLENSFGQISSEMPWSMDETSDEENDVISAPQQPAPQPEPNPEENDVISAPMNESVELDRIKMLSGLN